MKEKTLKFLEKNLSSEPSTFAEEAKWRQENEVWLKWSQGIAMKIIDYMQEHKLSRADIASRLGCSPQYVSKILSGHTNFSFKSIAEIEKCLNIRIMETSFA
ncbi:helix-turn-helix transcriptional regulator [uncultured Alloprevotella sp.]|jgi:Helix-turn-helix.|uniref:helix-turn-helix domain-containing protein n=1 Tax=uncultured Alloprevotella sp. TaxID=1283315 RepID=UPI0028EC9E90|nr:helix-turn-helix transcriptional regulator [uncultured Alloprevotella sp.]